MRERKEGGERERVRNRCTIAIYTHSFASRSIRDRVDHANRGGSRWIVDDPFVAGDCASATHAKPFARTKLESDCGFSSRSGHSFIIARDALRMLANGNGGRRATRKMRKIVTSQKRKRNICKRIIIVRVAGVEL